MDKACQGLCPLGLCPLWPTGGRDSEYSLAFLPKVEIQLWVDDARVDEVVDRIVEVARTGRMGDGKIFVLPATVPV